VVVTSDEAPWFEPKYVKSKEKNPALTCGPPVPEPTEVACAPLTYVAVRALFELMLTRNSAMKAPLILSVNSSVTVPTVVEVAVATIHGEEETGTKPLT
jgi:hypothetical protein